MSRAAGSAAPLPSGRSGSTLLVAPGGGWLACARFDHDVHLWALHPEPACRFRLAGHWGAVESLAASPDGARLASAGGEGAVRVWDVHAGVGTHVLDTDERRVLALVFLDRDTLRLALEGGAVVDWPLGGAPVLLRVEEGASAAWAASGGGFWWRAGRRVWRGGAGGAQEADAQEADAWEAGARQAEHELDPRARLVVADGGGIAWGPAPLEHVPVAHVSRGSGGGAAWSQPGRPEAALLALGPDELLVVGPRLQRRARRDGALRGELVTPLGVRDAAFGAGRWWLRAAGGAELLALDADGHVTRHRPAGERTERGGQLERADLRDLAGSLPGVGFAVRRPAPTRPPPLRFDESARLPVAPDQNAPPPRARHPLDEAAALLERVARALRERLRGGYRDQALIVDVHPSGTELELRTGERAIRMRLGHDGRRFRVELVDAEDDRVLAAPPTPAVRLARWLRRLRGEAEDAALLDRLEAPGLVEKRVARAGDALSIVLRLRALPTPATLAGWLEVLRARHG